jgi:transposase-like protein
VLKKKTQQEKDSIIKEWEESGIPMTKWCRQKEIPLTTFYGWKKRKNGQKTLRLHKKDFVNLKTELNRVEIELEYQEIKIRLSKDWDQKSLEKCLIALRTLSC